MSTYFGLDFGNSSLKVVQAKAVGGSSYLVSGINLVQNPAGSVDFLDKTVIEKLAPAVKALIHEAGIEDKRAILSVPESKVYSKLIHMPMMSEAELASAVRWEAEQFVPVPVDEVEIDYQVVQEASEQTNGQSLVYLVAAPKKLLQSMVDFVLSLGIEPLAVESEMVAVSRAMTYGMEKKSSILLLHMGALSTVMGIMNGSSLVFSHYMNTGGVALTRAVSQSLSLPILQAEEYKRTYGLDSTKLEGKVKESLLIIMEGIVNEIRKAIENNLNVNKVRVSKIILSGGGAYLPELGSYLGDKFGGMEILLGDPFLYAKAGKNILIPKEKSAYVVAAGLALRTE